MTNLVEAFYRRLYAFHKPTEVEEFYDPSQPRDKDGKWTVSGRRGANSGTVKSGTAKPTSSKIWSGVSADPDNRVKPTKKVSIPPDPENDYETLGAASRHMARNIWETDLGDGYRAEVRSATPHLSSTIRNDILGEISVQGEITYKGRVVGTFDRTITERKDRLEVDHTELYIDSAHRSKGVADRFNAHAIAQYQEMGVDRITLHAGSTVGGFAWARQGFRWASSEVALKVGSRALDIVEANAKHLPAMQNPEGQKVAQKARALRKALKAGEDVQPIHIASLGEQFKWEARDEGNSRFMTWPGKQAMLRSAWEGVYYFDANKTITAAASDLEHASLRAAFRAYKAKKVLLTDEQIDELGYNPRQPRDRDGKWTSGVSRANRERRYQEHRSRLTQLSQQSLDRAISGGLEGVFPHGSQGASAPWPSAPRKKGEKAYDAELVKETLKKPPVLEKVDPRVLHATQPGVVREHTEYYLTGEYNRTGRTSADVHNVGNRFPVVYVRNDGRHVILSGHHRALAAMIKGQDLDAIIVRENLRAAGEERESADNDNLWPESGSHHTSQGRWFRDDDEFGYNPNQPRDKMGKWTTGGTASLKASPLAASGKAGYMATTGRGEDTNDYSVVTAPKDFREKVANAYDDMPTNDPSSHKAFRALVKQVDAQFKYMTETLGIKFEAVDYDPYSSAHEMIKDVNENKRLRVLSTASTGSHPFFTDEENDKFRAVHDFFGHAATGRTFDRHGERATYLSHARTFKGDKDAIRALFTETEAQNAYVVKHHEFGDQKVALYSDDDVFYGLDDLR